MKTIPSADQPVTFYHHSTLAAGLGVDAATRALDGFWWLRVARGQERGPKWADQDEAKKQAKRCFKFARWCQREHHQAYLFQPHHPYPKCPR